MMDETAIMDWNADIARELRASGMSWTGVGRQFGINGDTVRIRLDQKYAAMRKNRNNLRRRQLREVPPLEPVTIAPPSDGRKVYQVERGGMRISLPFVSILEAR